VIAEPARPSIRRAGCRGQSKSGHRRCVTALGANARKSIWLRSGNEFARRSLRFAGKAGGISRQVIDRAVPEASAQAVTACGPSILNA
jgi:hypothetical protein